MDSQEIVERVKEIEEYTKDCEVAHMMEDKLHHDVLRSIASGDCDNPEKCAKKALGTLMIDFDRWYT